MVFSKYSFPLPNNGERYDLSQEELVKLLNDVYDRGFEHARDIYDLRRQGVTSWASSDGSTEWKEVRINE